MKILQVNKLYYPWIGGVEKVVQDIAEGLNDKVDMEVLVCQSKGRGERKLINGVKTTKASNLGIYFSMPVSITFPFLLAWKNRKADILHFHLPFPLGVISCLLVRPKGKVVITWHSDIIRQKNIMRLYRVFLKRFLKRVDRIIVTSPNMMRNSIYLKDFKEKCVVVPLGIDTKRFVLDDKTQRKVKKVRERYGHKLILYVGRLIYYKGLEYLVQAMKKVEAKLLLVGEGKLKEKLKKMVYELGVKDKVVFLGSLSDDDLPVYYHACNLFVLPSVKNSEAFGIVQLEAMVCGKPVVSTNLPTGVPFVNQHRKTGITVPPQNSDALAKAMNELLENPDLREKYGQYAKQRVEKEFTKEVMVERIWEVYKDLYETA